MSEVPGVSRRAKRGLQCFGAQLPPIPRVNIPRLQSGGGACGRAKAVLFFLEQHIAGTLHCGALVPQL